MKWPWRKKPATMSTTVDMFGYGFHREGAWNHASQKFLVTSETFWKYENGQRVEITKDEYELLSGRKSATLIA